LALAFTSLANKSFSLIFFKPKLEGLRVKLVIFLLFKKATLVVPVRDTSSQTSLPWTTKAFFTPNFFKTRAKGELD